MRKELHKYDDDVIFGWSDSQPTHYIRRQAFDLYFPPHSESMDEQHELMGRPDSPSEAVFSAHIPRGGFFHGRHQKTKVSASHAQARARILSQQKTPQLYASQKQEAEARGPGLVRRICSQSSGFNAA